MKLTDEDKSDLVAFLQEYLLIFEKSKKHYQAHKKEPCPKCELAKRLLRRLKNEKTKQKR